MGSRQAFAIETQDAAVRLNDSADNHVVDWQLIATVPGREDPAARGTRDRIRNLETQAAALLRQMSASPDLGGMRVTLSELDQEIAALRAERAWRRANARSC
jgi:hypothetical protein